MSPIVYSTQPINRWASRVIPAILLVMVAIACYVVTGRICGDILIPNHEYPAAIAILVLLYVWLILMVTCYLRVFLTILYNPGVVPRGPSGTNAATPRERHEYNTSPVLEKGQQNGSKGMEQFYNKDVFQVDKQGGARWCSTCQWWKPDRSHHSSELGVCVRKMDHYCPWMGGIISETSFKFFIQFNMYAAFFCAVCLGSTAYATRKQVVSDSGLDPWILVVLGLSSFFGIFTFTMSTNTARFAALNLTTIDIIDYKVKKYWLAIRVPRSIPPGEGYRLQSFPPPGMSGSTDRTHTFAIVETREGENPWDLGYFKNWQSIMGFSIIDWLLPIRRSPESEYSSNVSDYPLGELYPVLRARHNLGNLDTPKEKPSKKRKQQHRSRH